MFTMIYRHRFTISAPLFGLVFAFSVHAQDDAAKPQAAPAADATSAAAADAISFAKPDPAVDTIVDSNPQTPAEVLHAAAILSDLDRADLAKKFLDRLATAKPDENSLAEAAAKVDKNLLLRIAANPALQPAGQQLVDAALAAAAKRFRDPNQLKTEIDRLGDPSRSVQREAIRRILAAHDDAVPALLAALADPNRRALRPTVKQLLVALSTEALRPLFAALQSENPALKVEVIDVLALLGSPDTVPFLAAPATLESESPQVQAAARKALEEIQAIKDPTEADAVTLLTREIQKALNRDRLLDLDSNGRVDVWAWNAAAQLPYKQNLPADQAAVEMVVPLALDLLRLAPTSDTRARQLAATAVFESLANRTGLDNSAARRQFSKSFGAGDVTMIEDALSFAIENKNYAAAMVAAEILGNIGDRSLLNSPGPMVRPLVQAVERGDRRSRFAAAEAIMKLKPTAPFAGSSDLMNALAFFADSPGMKRALVVFPNDTTATKLAGMLRGLGYDVDIATNGRQANLQAISNGDYELALLSSRIDKPPVWVLIQQLRHDPRSARLPVGFMAEDADGDINRMHILADNDPLAAAFGRPLTPEGMKFQIDRLVERGKNEIVPNEVRKQQALAALDWLKQLNATSPRDFDLRPYEAQLTRALHRPVTSAGAADLLALMGTHTAVKSLAEMANMNTQPLPIRQAAAAGFSTAVGKYGIQLTIPEIKHQYDRYNQSALEDQSTQQLLGLMLDAIEASSKISHNAP